ncbi:MAG: hypothetical protein ABJA85_07455 [Bacteroidota bacterium]
MRNGVGEKFEKRSPGTNDTKRIQVLQTLKRAVIIKDYDVSV